MSSINPYAASVSPVENVPEMSLGLASQNQRFLTLIVDNLVLMGVNFAVGFLVGFFLVIAKPGELDTEAETAAEIVSTAISLLVSFFYYALMEAFAGVTVGKMLVGTKVIDEGGGRATLAQCFGRSACRFIPFEALSFFGNNGFPIGWHDRIPRTRVVKSR